MSLVDGLLNQTVDTIYSVSKDRYGDVTKSSEYTNEKCRWQNKIGRLVNTQGEDINYEVEVWLSKEHTDIRNDWRVVKDSKEYQVKAYAHLHDLMGNLDHIKLYLV